MKSNKTTLNKILNSIYVKIDNAKTTPEVYRIVDEFIENHQTEKNVKIYEHETNETEYIENIFEAKKAVKKELKNYFN